MHVHTITLDHRRVHAHIVTPTFHTCVCTYTLVSNLAHVCTYMITLNHTHVYALAHTQMHLLTPALSSPLCPKLITFRFLRCAVYL